jgi:hypothetical protein
VEVVERELSSPEARARPKEVGVRNKLPSATKARIRSLLANLQQMPTSATAIALGLAD